VPVNLGRLSEFIVGYLVILATPGPNLLAIGGMAALRGQRGALPICLGVAMGTGALGTTLLVAVTIAPGDGWDRTGRLVGAGLLGWLAISVARQRPPDEGAPMRIRVGKVAAFGAGFFTAVTNPMTAAFFAAQFLGPLRDDEATIAVAPITAASMALVYFTGVAALLARPAFGATIQRWHQPIRLTAAAVLALMAFSTIRAVF
jgi:threonine/homoserine/homoserine lactone efflux protein